MVAAMFGNCSDGAGCETSGASAHAAGSAGSRSGGVAMIAAVTVLAIIGALFQFVGIVLLAASDLLPGARRLGRWLRVHSRSVERRIREFFRRPPRPIVASVAVSDSSSVSDSASAVVSTGATTVEEKVEFLLRRDQEAQRHMNDVAKRLTELQGDVPQRLSALSDELKGHVAAGVAAAQADFRATRLLGSVALALGLVLTTWATLI
jgi:hypothetical protein